MKGTKLRSRSTSSMGILILDPLQIQNSPVEYGHSLYPSDLPPAIANPKIAYPPIERSIRHYALDIAYNITSTPSLPMLALN